ncbi:MAG: 30S ribosomal protein S11 [Candidatus Hydrothermales bacterium]
MAKKGRKKKKEKKILNFAVVHIQSTFNNTIITVTDEKGSTLCWASSGSVGFKGTRKGTPFAASKAAEEVVKKVKEFGIQEIEVRLKGPGQGREAALRTLHSQGLKIVAIKDVTPIPHNGTRPPKRRRV